MLSIALPAANSIEKEWIVVCPAIIMVVSSLYAIENEKKLIDRGGVIRTITDITYPYIDSVQQHLDIGDDIRHFDRYTGIMFSVLDRKISTSAINIDLKRISLNEPISMIWTDDPTYAEYLISTFELLWEKATPATERIEELLKEGPPKA